MIINQAGSRPRHITLGSNTHPMSTASATAAIMIMGIRRC